jgi:hypothetical protein
MKDRIISIKIKHLRLYLNKRKEIISKNKVKKRKIRNLKMEKKKYKNNIRRNNQVLRKIKTEKIKVFVLFISEMNKIKYMN